MEKVLQILVVLVLLILAVTYYIKAEKTKYRPYYPVGLAYAPADLPWGQPAMDPDNQLLFMIGEQGWVEVLDAGTGKQLSRIPVGAEAGTQVFDPETRYLYCACGDGTLSIFKQISRTTYTLQQTLVTQPGCWLMNLDGGTKKIYLAVGAVNLPLTDAIECRVYSNL
jgi:DNA-binding beta-propeller fold protein YncE